MYEPLIITHQETREDAFLLTIAVSVSRSCSSAELFRCWTKSCRGTIHYFIFLCQFYFLSGAE